MSDWPIVQLNEIVEITSSKRVKRVDYVEDGVPFFRSKEVIERSKGNDISTKLFIKEDHFQKIEEKFGAPLVGDILLTSVGTLGVPYQVQTRDRFYFKDGNLTWFRNFSERVNPKFLFYWLTSPIAKRKFDEITIGSTQKALTIVALKSLDLQLPPINIQDGIVKILDALNETLTNNRQTNQTLEHIAQAIFKSWFVDFEPTRAKIAAKQTSQDPERAAMAAISGKALDELDQLNPKQLEQLQATAALFPDAFVDSELGEIPEGWDASTLGEHFNVVMGQSPTGDTYNEDGQGMLFFQGRRDFGFRYPMPRVYTTKPKRLAKAGDTLISVRAPVGDRNMAAQECCLGRGVASIRHKSEARSFTYAFIGHIEKNLSDSGSDGTVFNSINKNELGAVGFVAPRSNLLNFFEDKIKSIDQHIEVNSIEIRVLKKLRDTLLPKLLSGKFAIQSPQTEL